MEQNIQLNTILLERDLGVMVSNTGSFTSQVDHVIGKANRALGRIKNTFSQLKV